MSGTPVADQLAYTPPQAAQILGISRSRVDDLVRRGELASIKLPPAKRDKNGAEPGRTSTRLIRREALVAWLDRIEQAS